MAHFGPAAVGRDQDNRRSTIGRLGVVADLLCQLDTAHRRHIPIGQHKTGTMVAEQLEAFLSIARRNNVLDAARLKDGNQKCSDGKRIRGYQYAYWPEMGHIGTLWLGERAE
jgi:hypothetical protein